MACHLAKVASHFAQVTCHFTQMAFHLAQVTCCFTVVEGYFTLAYVDMSFYTCTVRIFDGNWSITLHMTFEFYTIPWCRFKGRRVAVCAQCMYVLL